VVVSALLQARVDRASANFLACQVGGHNHGSGLGKTTASTPFKTDSYIDRGVSSQPLTRSPVRDPKVRPTRPDGGTDRLPHRYFRRPSLWPHPPSGPPTRLSWPIGVYYTTWNTHMP
jgi:hypothetical protein